MPKRKALWILSFALVMAVVVAGCTQKDPFSIAVQASADVSDSVQNALQAEPGLVQSQVLDVGQQKIYLDYCGKVTQGNQTFRAAVVKIKASGQTGPSLYLSAAQTFVASAQDQDIAALPAGAQTYLKAVQTALAGVEAAIASAKTQKGN